MKRLKEMSIGHVHRNEPAYTHTHSHTFTHGGYNNPYPSFYHTGIPDHNQSHHHNPPHHHHNPTHTHNKCHNPPHHNHNPSHAHHTHTPSHTHHNHNIHTGTLPICNNNQTLNHSHLNDALTPTIMSKLFKCEKYITKTIKEYTITPTRNVAIGMLVSPNLLLKIGDHISCYIDTDRLNYFRGIINGYDNITGLLSISHVYDITGTFTTNSIYSIHQILAEPDAFIMNERIDRLYQYFFNSNTIEHEIEHTNHLLIGKLENYTYDLFMYAFEKNIRIEPSYELCDNYLMLKINELYEYYFDVNIIQNPGFNPNDNLETPVHLEQYVIQLYLYLFDVNILDYSKFDILNGTYVLCD